MSVSGVLAARGPSRKAKMWGLDNVAPWPMIQFKPRRTLLRVFQPLLQKSPRQRVTGAGGQLSVHVSCSQRLVV